MRVRLLLETSSHACARTTVSAAPTHARSAHLGRAPQRLATRRPMCVRRAAAAGAAARSRAASRGRRSAPCARGKIWTQSEGEMRVRTRWGGSGRSPCAWLHKPRFPCRVTAQVAWFVAEVEARALGLSKSWNAYTDSQHKTRRKARKRARARRLRT
eukprot:1119576-Pleurochrysis_carterae.AAC.4